MDGTSNYEHFGPLCVCDWVYVNVRLCLFVLIVTTNKSFVKQYLHACYHTFFRNFPINILRLLRCFLVNMCFLPWLWFFLHTEQYLQTSLTLASASELAIIKKKSHEASYKLAIKLYWVITFFSFVASHCDYERDFHVKNSTCFQSSNQIAARMNKLVNGHFISLWQVSFLVSSLWPLLVTVVKIWAVPAQATLKARLLNLKYRLRSGLATRQQKRKYFK